MPINSFLYPAPSTPTFAYNVANSIRFDDGSTSYLQKSASAGNRKTFTFSTWLKRSSLLGGGSGYNTFFSSDQAAENSFRFTFNDDSGTSDDKLMVYYYTGSHQLKLITNRLFRDVSAWYHIVLAVDTTQGTASNRVKIYINGVQETSFSTETYPSENLDTSVNQSGAPTRVGAGTDLYFDGYMAETVLIDGTAYAASDFGEFDEDSGIWKPIDVSGLTFGTNGFYLNYENSSELGTDANGGTTLSETNLTAVDQSTDTPTNNFATLNPLGTVQLGTLSEGNLKLVSSSAYKIATSTIAISSGKWYVENKITGGSPDAMVGVIDVQDYQTNSSINYAGDKTNSVGYYKDGRKFIANSASSYGASYTTDDIIGIALDLDSGTKTITFYKNGASQGAINLPTAGSEEWYFLPSPYNATIEVNFGSPPFAISSGNTDGNGYGNFEYAVPSGYYSLNSKNLAEYG